MKRLLVLMLMLISGCAFALTGPDWLQIKNGPFITPEQFRYVSGVAQTDTQAVQAAIEAAKATGTLFIDKNYTVTHVEIANANGFKILGSGILLGKPTGTYESVLSIKDSTSVYEYGSLQIDAQMNASYSCGLAIYASSSFVSHIQLQNVVVTHAPVGIRIGDSNNLGAVVSESSIMGGYTYDTPRAIQVFGYNTAFSFTDFTCQCDSLPGSDWPGYYHVAIENIGSLLHYKGGEILSAGTITGQTIIMRPASASVSPTTNNVFGSVHITGTEIEAANQLCFIGNQYNVTPIASTTGVRGMLSLSQCTGYNSQDQYHYIYADASFTGNIDVQNCNFYSGTYLSFRGHYNIYCENPLTNVFCDKMSFGAGYPSGLRGIYGGNVHHDMRHICDTVVATQQSLASGSTTQIIFDGAYTSGDLLHYSSNYATSTGVFTVPAGGFNTIEAVAEVFTTNAIATGILTLNFGGSTISQDYGANRSLKVHGYISNPTPGATMSVQFYSPSNATVVTNSSRFWINGEN